MGQEYASPPCFLHELTDEGFDVAKWRKAERKRLGTTRLAIDSKVRNAHATAIAGYVEKWVGAPSKVVLGAYWPMKGEPNLHPWLEEFRRRGGRTALPVVVKQGAPLIFRIWEKDTRMERGVWDIPAPADSEEVIPDVAIAPLVGFDGEGYRLGNGGGFFDRTLAALSPRPRVIGVGYDLLAIETIHPQWHDIPMDAIATESGLKTYDRKARAL